MKKIIDELIAVTKGRKKNRLVLLSVIADKHRVAIIGDGIELAADIIIEMHNNENFAKLLQLAVDAYRDPDAPKP